MARVCACVGGAYLFKAERSSPFFVCIPKVPFLLTLSLHVRSSFIDITLTEQTYKHTGKHIKDTLTQALKQQKNNKDKQISKQTSNIYGLSCTHKDTHTHTHTHTHTDTPKQRHTHTCRGTVARLVCRCARVSRSPTIRTPLESITTFPQKGTRSDEESREVCMWRCVSF